MSDLDQLKALRVRIDSLDEKILELISERASCAQEVARVKMLSLPAGEKPVFYRPEREAWVLKHIMELNQGPLDNEEVARLFREIMSSCLALEQPLKVAYLGPEGTFSQAAAMKHFGHAVISVPRKLVARHGHQRARSREHDAGPDQTHGRKRRRTHRGRFLDRRPRI